MAATQVSTFSESWAICNTYGLGTRPYPAGPTWWYGWRKELDETVRSEVTKLRLKIVAQRWVELRGLRTVSFIYLQLSSQPWLFSFSSLPLWNCPRGSPLKHWRASMVASGKWGPRVLQNSTGTSARTLRGAAPSKPCGGMLDPCRPARSGKSPDRLVISSSEL